MNPKLSRPFLISNLLALGFTFGAMDFATAQTSPTTTEMQASAERDRNSQILRSAIQRIARRPSDPDALIDAGNASLALDDPKAALNFFTRANAARPNDGRIKLGLASANLRTENPFDALRLFDEAVKLGMAERAVAADRALAFDLLGNFSRAQQDYALAGTIDSSDALRIKHAVSLSLSGKGNEADGLLVPLLQRNVGEAWRARAFMLAARGDFKESVRVTQGFMDARSASRFEPFLRRMPELTGAQQAAAIHFGHFPTRNLGRDSDAVRTVASATPVPSNPGGSGKLIPAGRPLGTQATANPANSGSPASVAQVAPATTIRNNPAPASNAVAIRSASSGNFQNDVARTRILATENAAASLSLVRVPLPAVTPQTTVAAAQPNGRMILPQMPVSQSPSSASQRSSEIFADVPPEQPKPAQPLPQPQPQPQPLPQPQPQSQISSQSPGASPPAGVTVSELPATNSNTAPPIPQPFPAATTAPLVASAATTPTITAPSPVAPAPSPIVGAPVSTPISGVSSSPTVSNASPPPAPGAVPVNVLTNSVEPAPIVSGPTVSGSFGAVPVATAPVTAAPNNAIGTPSPNPPLGPNIVTPPIDAVAPTTPTASQISAAPASLPKPIPSIQPVEVPASTVAIQDSVPAIDDFSPPGVSTIVEPAAPAPASAPTPTPTPAPPKSSGFDLDSIVSSIEVPESEQQAVVPVDLNAIKRTEPKKTEPVVPATKSDKKTVVTDKKAPAETHPPRIWVQISTGDVAAFRGDMRRHSGKNPDLFKGYQGWSSPWSKMNRLVVGPFGDLKAARKWESDFRKAGGNGFVWQSANGTVVEKLK